MARRFRFEKRGSWKEKVRISCTVTVQSGAYASSISSGFAIHDETAKIYAIDGAYSYQLGQKVTVTGTVGVEKKQRNIKLDNSTLLSGYGTITPQPVQTAKVDDAEGAPHHSTSARLSWARLRKRVFDIDFERCPHCGGTLKVIAAIENPTVIAKILAHLGLYSKFSPASGILGSQIRRIGAHPIGIERF